MRFLGIFCVLFGALQWGILLWHYRFDLDALLANWALWGSLALAGMLIVAGLSFLFRPAALAVRLFALTCAFYALGLYAEIIPLYQAQLLQALGMGTQIAVVVGGLVVLRLSYGLISRAMLKRFDKAQREKDFAAQADAIRKARIE
jgi:hypothetical protein